MTWRRLVLACLLAGSVGSPLDQAAANLRRWRAFPEQFVAEQFGATPDPWQREALRMLVEGAHREEAAWERRLRAKADWLPGRQVGS